METSRGFLRRTGILLGHRHTSNFNRLTAKAIDGLVVVAVFFLVRALWVPLGVIGAVVLCSFADGLGAGQSVGKRIMGLRVLDDPTGVSCSFRSSFVRNFPFVLCIVFATAPLLRLFLVLLVLPWVGLELYLLLSLESGVRLGDVLGNTIVVEALDAPRLDRAGERSF